MLDAIMEFAYKPPLYSPSSDKFWNDKHISKGMLKAHLNPNVSSATRKQAFIEKSVQWITNIVPPTQYPALLDLGCGPGLYAERFAVKGYAVTGVDLSPRSLQYARSNAEKKQLDIEYLTLDYSKLNYYHQYDICTLIYCDFGVMNPVERNNLLHNIYQALKPKGKFIFDVFTPVFYQNNSEYRKWSTWPEGFWAAEPYLLLESFHRYDKQQTFLEQYIVATKNNVQCYNNWNHAFTTKELETDLQNAGFSHCSFYSDVAGKPYHLAEPVTAVVATK